MNKLASAEDALSVIEDGMTVGIGGWGPRRKPMALVRALLRSDVRDLTLVASVSYTHLTLPTNREV